MKAVEVRELQKRLSEYLRCEVRIGLPNDPSVYPHLDRVLSPGAADRLLDAERADRGSSTQTRARS